MFENFHPRQQLDTIEDHHNKRTIEDQSCWWVTTLKSYFFWQQLDTIEGPPQQTYFIYIYFVCAKISCKYSLNNWLIMLHKMKKTKSEKNMLKKIGLRKKLDTIPAHPIIYTNSELFWKNLTQYRPMALIRIPHYMYTV